MRDALKSAAHLVATVFVVPALGVLCDPRARSSAPTARSRGRRRRYRSCPVSPAAIFVVHFWSRSWRTATERQPSSSARSSARLARGSDRTSTSGHAVTSDSSTSSATSSSAPAVQVPSGPRHHGMADLDRPIREQPGTRAVVRIGEGAWIGSAAVVLADVGTARSRRCWRGGDGARSGLCRRRRRPGSGHPGSARRGRPGVRILYLTHRLPYAPNRGDRIRAFHMLREMSRFAEVSLFSLVHDEEEAGGRPACLSRGASTCLASTARGISFARRPRLPPSRPLTHVLLDAPDAREQLASVVGRKPSRPGGGVLFRHGPFRARATAGGSAVRARHGRRGLGEVGTPGRALRGPRRWVYRRESATLRTFEAAAARRARVTLVVNDRERDVMREIDPAVPVSVVSNGIDLDAFRPREDAEASSTVIFCGVMNYAAE